MGNHKFRLSDMIPNAWFRKLKKDMAKTRNQNSHHPIKKNNPPTSSSSSFSLSSSSSSTASSSSLPSSTATIEKSGIPQRQSKTRQPHLLSPQRKSYYFTRDLTPPPQSTTNNPKSSDTHFPDFPRKSSKQRHSRNRASNRLSPKLVTTPVSGGCLCRATIESVRTNPDFKFEDYPNSPIDTSSGFQSILPELRSDNDIVIDTDDKLLNTNFDELITICKLELPQIITKKTPQKMKKKKEKNDCIEANNSSKTSAKFGERNDQVSRHRNSTTCREQRNSPVKRLSVSSPGVRLRANSPRIASCMKIQAHGRKSLSSNSGSRNRRSGLSESLAVVKSSADPQRDFRESMVEMILENNIKASKELEDLLACYLQLNSDEYHELIIKVFKQIWFDLEDARLN